MQIVHEIPGDWYRLRWISSLYFVFWPPVGSFEYRIKDRFSCSTWYNLSYMYICVRLTWHNPSYRYCMCAVCELTCSTFFFWRPSTNRTQVLKIKTNSLPLKKNCSLWNGKIWNHWSENMSWWFLIANNSKNLCSLLHTELTISLSRQQILLIFLPILDYMINGLLFWSFWKYFKCCRR
jgi:hypothetical protein